ncbi:hypothetical protein [Streptomyces sp. NBC_01176]
MKDGNPAATTEPGTHPGTAADAVRNAAGQAAPRTTADVPGTAH